MKQTEANETGKKKKPLEEFQINRLHPVQVEYSYPIGARIDMDRELPLDIEEEDPEELLDMLSSPTPYEDRIAPLHCQYNSETLTGLNPVDLQIKFIRKLAFDLTKIAADIEIANKQIFGEKGVISFLGLGLDPETISRLIEMDYDTADNVYSRLTALFEGGFITPIATTPFHTLLPLYQFDFEIRLLIRMGLEIYWPVLKKYNRAVARVHGEKYFMVPFWLPEGGYNARVLQILHEETEKRCKDENIEPFHVIVMLDVEQSNEREQDVLMKRWNTLRPSATTRDIVTILFKERTFTDWVIEGHPSTKKQLDRTIAKVDAQLRDKQVDHLWSHFEPLDTLLSTFKTAQNFEQKLVKLTELKYQPAGPDVFVRRKLLKKYGVNEDEPRRTTLKENTVWSAWPETEGSMVRFLGYDTIERAFKKVQVLGENLPFEQKLSENKIRKRIGSPVWKPALFTALTRVHRAVVGEPKTFMGGMLGLIREMLPFRRVPLAMRNIENFLVRFARVQYKEHFIHHGISEAEIELGELCRTILLKDLPDDLADEDLDDEDCAVIGCAAHAIFHAHMGLTSTGFAFENIDNRAVYDQVVMMSLAVVHGITALRWRGEEEKGREIFDIFKTELIGFGEAYERYNIEKLFGVEKKLWEKTIASEAPDESDLNVVERAARRIGAKHLRLMGYRKEFDRKDASISASTGHIWTHEVNESPNLKWENDIFCGLREE